jgi:transposase
MNRRPYPSDVSDEEGEFVAPYLSLLPQTAAQRRHERRGVFNAVRCRALPCAAVRCRALPCAAVRCRALPCAAVRCRALPCAAVRSIVRTSVPWSWLPTNFPPWEAVYQQTRRWIAAVWIGPTAGMESRMRPSRERSMIRPISVSSSCMYALRVDSPAAFAL